MTIAHNISINVTDADSPAGARRRMHLRSLSDVTPAARAAPRTRSHSDRPAPAAAAAALQPRAVRSARTSPAASHERLDQRNDHQRADAGSVLGDPWRKMSELDLRTAARSTARQSLDGARVLDPWVKNSTAHVTADATRDRDDASRPNVDEPKRDGTFRRGKLERKAAVVCESCGNESCECWRPRSPGCPRTPRAARSLTTARCTCERSPRVSPARLAPRQPVRALSDDEARPRRLYKSSSQKMICTSMEGESVKKAADPLLETTC